jgi:hypothetical protein
VLFAVGGVTGCTDDRDSASPQTGGTTSSPTTIDASESFSCPVSRRQVEDVYQRIDFQDSTSSTTSCRFERFDGDGALVLAVEAGSAAAYRDAVEDLVDAETVDGVGDQAISSESRTRLVARSGDRVLTLENSSLDGFEGATDASSQSAARRTASIALARLALAG